MIWLANEVTDMDEVLQELVNAVERRRELINTLMEKLQDFTLNNNAVKRMTQSQFNHITPDEQTVYTVISDDGLFSFLYVGSQLICYSPATAGVASISEIPYENDE